MATCIQTYASNGIQSAHVLILLRSNVMTVFPSCQRKNVARLLHFAKLLQNYQFTQSENEDDMNTPM